MRRFGRLLTTLVAFGAVIAMPGLASAGGTSWSVRVLPWSVPGPTNADFEDVGCAASLCAAVGYEYPYVDGQVPLVGSTDGSSWSATAPALPSGDVGGELQAVSCTAALGCVSVGVAITDTGSLPIAAVTTASGTVVTNLPVAGDVSYSNLFGVSCVAATCLAVGSAGTSNTALVETFADGTWTASTFPDSTFGAGVLAASFQAIDCVDAGDCTVTGTSSTSTTTTAFVGQLSGGAWSFADVTPPTGDRVSFERISCWDAGDCTSVGSSDGGATVVATINGLNATFEVLPIPSPMTYEQLAGIQCASASDCTAVGRSGTSATTDGVVASFDGSAWSQSLIPAPTGTTELFVSGVSCSDASCVIAGGSSVPGASERSFAYLGTSDGSTTPIPIVVGGPAQSWLNDVACASSSTCVAVGGMVDLADQTSATVETRSSGTWRVTQPAAPAGAAQSVLNAVSCPTTATCVAVGSYETKAGAGLPYVDRLAHGAWVATSLPLPKGALGGAGDGVSCTSTSTCVAVGTWSERPTTSTWCPDTCVQDGFGDALSSGRWHVLPAIEPPKTRDPYLVAVSCWRASHCLAVGGFAVGGNFFGLAATLQGSKWSYRTVDAPSGGAWADLDDVDCPSASSCFAVGSFQASGGQYPLAATGAPSGPMTAVAPTGTAAPMWGTFNGISCLAATCVAVGTTGTPGLIGTERGGTWTTTTLPDSAPLDGLDLGGVSCFSGGCTAVGAADEGEAVLPAVATDGS